jgi:hypothetical protein
MRNDRLLGKAKTLECSSYIPNLGCLRFQSFASQ